MFSEKYFLEKIVFPVFQFMLSMFFAIIFWSQVLGILGCYFKPAVLILVPLSTLIVFLVWRKRSSDFYVPSVYSRDNKTGSGVLNITAWIAGFVLLLLIIVPLVNWPGNTLVEELHWDAGEYHFPKAVELFRTGSANDFSISYGDYPFGYESLLAFDLLLTGDVSLFRISHVLIAVFVVLAGWLLFAKFSRLPKGLLFLLIVFLFLSGLIDRFNPWVYLRYEIFLVGKNDLLLTACVLAAMFFSVIGRNDEKQTDWFGLGICTALAMSIKPNGGFILVVLWIISLGELFKQKKKIREIFGVLTVPLFFAASGFIWVVRNLISLGALIDEASIELVDQTIFNSFLLPGGLTGMPKEFMFSVLLLIFSIVFTVVYFQKTEWKKVLLHLVILVSFIITPASTNLQTPSLYAWRFGLILLVYQFILLVYMGESVFQSIIDRILGIRAVVFVLAGIVLLGSGWLFVSQIDLFRYVPRKTALLERPYAVEGELYPSVFDYVQETIHNKVVWVEGERSFYAYDENFTNSVTRNEPAEFLIALREVPNLEENGWKEIYSDGVGKVYQRDME